MKRKISKSIRKGMKHDFLKFDRKFNNIHGELWLPRKHRGINLQYPEQARQLFYELRKYITSNLIMHKNFEYVTFTDISASGIIVEVKISHPKLRCVRLKNQVLQYDFMNIERVGIETVYAFFDLYKIPYTRIDYKNRCN